MRNNGLQAMANTIESTESCEVRYVIHANAFIPVVYAARSAMEKISELQKVVAGLEGLALKCLDAEDSDRARDIMMVCSPPASGNPCHRMVYVPEEASSCHKFGDGVCFVANRALPGIFPRKKTQHSGISTPNKPLRAGPTCHPFHRLGHLMAHGHVLLLTCLAS